MKPFPRMAFVANAAPPRIVLVDAEKVGEHDRRSLCSQVMPSRSAPISAGLDRSGSGVAGRIASRPCRGHGHEQDQDQLLELGVQARSARTTPAAKGGATSSSPTGDANQ